MLAFQRTLANANFYPPRFFSVFFPLKFVFFRRKHDENCSKYLFLPNYKHMFLVKPFRSHNEKITEWINYHLNKILIAHTLWKLLGKFPMILTKSCKMRLQPLQSSFVSFRQSSWKFSILHERSVRQVISM